MRYQLMARQIGDKRWYPIARAETAAEALLLQNATRLEDPTWEVWCAKVEPSIDLDMGVLQ